MPAASASEGSRSTMRWKPLPIPIVLIDPDDRLDYGEPRYRLFGSIDGRLHVVIFTTARRDRIISEPKSREQEHYDARQTSR